MSFLLRSDRRTVRSHGRLAVPAPLAFLIALMSLALQSGCVTTVEGNAIEQGTNAERVKAHIQLARGYLEERNFQRARTPLEKALAIDSRSVEAHVLKAFVHQREEEWEIAEDHYKTAIRIDPKHSQALNNYGSFLYARERFDDAVKPLEQAVKDTEYQARSQAYENLGLAQLALVNTPDAKSSFERALRLNDRQLRSSLELASIYQQEGDLVAAMDHYSRFRRLTRRQSPRSLCLGMQLTGALGLNDDLASFTMALRNLYPGSEEAADCPVQGPEVSLN